MSTFVEYSPIRLPLIIYSGPCNFSLFFFHSFSCLQFLSVGSHKAQFEFCIEIDRYSRIILISAYNFHMHNKMHVKSMISRDIANIVKILRRTQWRSSL